MSRDKKWASSKKDQLLVENFRKFMEEGDFSADEELSERTWGQMGKDIMKGDFTGKKRAKEALDRANHYLWLIDNNLRHTGDTIERAIKEVERDSEENIKRDLEIFGADNLKDFIDKFGESDALHQMEKDHQDWVDGVIDKREAAQRKKDRANAREAEENRRKNRQRDNYERDPSDSFGGSKKSGGDGYGGDHGGGYSSYTGAPWDE